MGINIDPSIIIKFFNDIGYRKKIDIIRFLESVANEAQQLYDIWDSIVKTLAKGNGISNEEVQELLSLRIYMRNGQPLGKLEYFYRNMSLALGGKVNSDWLDKIYSHLAGVIVSRNNLSKYIDGYIKKNYDGLFLSPENQEKSIDSVVALMSILGNEVAALKALPEIMRLAKIN